MDLCRGVTESKAGLVRARRVLSLQTALLLNLRAPLRNTPLPRRTKSRIPGAPEEEGAAVQGTGRFDTSETTCGMSPVTRRLPEFRSMLPLRLSV